MTKHYKILILRFAYLHIHPGGGFEKLIKLTPQFQAFLDGQARMFLAEILDFADAHVPHDTRNVMGFDDWLRDEPTREEHLLFDKWMATLQEMPVNPKGWEEVDTSNG
jgi:hypothetical protein